jgi:hypothetical protein
MITKTKPNDPRYELDESRSVEVYRNLHKQCYSIKQDGLVKAHADEISLKKCTFHVNEKGRDRVRKTKRKEVHAWVKGFLSKLFDLPMEYNRIHYNPYKTDGFMHRVETGAFSATFCEIVQADRVSLIPGGIYKS